MTVLTEPERLLLLCLRSAIRRDSISLDAPLSLEDWKSLRTLAVQQRLIPLMAESFSDGRVLSSVPGEWNRLREAARKLTIRQAAGTAEFLLLYERLRSLGLSPAVVKGIVCRSLYPEPEQRASSDEDLLIAPEDYPAYRDALLDCGLHLLDPDTPAEGNDEVTFVDPERKLYLEVHMRLFSTSEEAKGYRDLNRFFEGVLARTVELPVYGQKVRTLEPTDHLLFLLCHAYKHMLYGGVGIRQICDLCLFAARYENDVDWTRLRQSCSELNMLKLAAAFFRIGQQRLDISAPAVFAGLEVDELPLLKDCLGGGLYGADDPDRLHSSHLTLDAVAADRQGRGRRGMLRALFPKGDGLKRSYPYLKQKPWLLPLAWGQRMWRYASARDTSAGKSLEIGRERIALLKQYELLK